MMGSAGCLTGVPPFQNVKTTQKEEHYTRTPTYTPEAGPGYWDDPLYRENVWACAARMNDARADIRNANTLAVVSGVATLASGFVTGILAAQTTSARRDSADLALLERPETYTAFFTLVGGLTTTTSPFLLGTATASSRYTKMRALWDNTEDAFNAVEIAAGEHLPNLARIRILARAYADRAMADCRGSLDIPSPRPLPPELEDVLTRTGIHRVDGAQTEQRPVEKPVDEKK